VRVRVKLTGTGEEIAEEIAVTSTVPEGLVSSATDVVRNSEAFGVKVEFGDWVSAAEVAVSSEVFNRRD
jgi:hypothetical protein